MQDNYKNITGRLCYRVFCDDDLIESIDESNLIVNNSKTILSHLIKGGATATWAITQIGFGTGTVAPYVGQGALVNPTYLAFDSITLPDAYSTSFNFTLGSTSANGKSISEFGLLSANNTLFSRKTRAKALVKNSSIVISGSWIITF
jgi:hypothetical protein